MLSNFLNLRTYTYSANKTKRMSSLLPTCTFIGCCYWNLESESADNLWIPKRTASTDGRSFGWDLLARMQWPRFRGSSAHFPTVSTSSTTNAVVNKGRGVGFTSWWWLVMMMLGSVTQGAVITIKRGQRHVKFDWVSISLKIWQSHQIVCWSEIRFWCFKTVFIVRSAWKLS